GLQLREQEIEIDAAFAAPRDDADLAGQRVRTAETVDLASVGRAHHRQQDLVACRPIVRQIAGFEEGTAGRAAAHEEAGDGSLHGNPDRWDMADRGSFARRRAPRQRAGAYNSYFISA